jgi:hypothetical protein
MDNGDTINFLRYNGPNLQSSIMTAQKGSDRRDKMALTEAEKAAYWRWIATRTVEIQAERALAGKSRWAMWRCKQLAHKEWHTRRFLGWQAQEDLWQDEQARAHKGQS